MSKKIYISPSDQVRNLYAYGGTNEAIQCRRIAAACKIALERCGFEVKTNFADGSNAMYERVKESNAWGADLHVCIHTNAGGGSGCVVFVDEIDERHKKYAQPVYDAVSAITKADEKYGVRKANFYEIRKTTGLCVYCECAFHDNATDAKWIIEHVADIGEAIAKGICKGAGVAYKAPTAETSELDVATEWAVKAGLINGYGNGEYGWGDPLTRGQMARILYRFYKMLKG